MGKGFHKICSGRWSAIRLFVANPAQLATLGDYFHIMTSPDEHEWIERLRAGDRAAQEELLRRHGPALEAMARWRRWGIPDQEREDLKQFLFMSVLEAARTFNGACPVEAFVIRTAISRCYDFLRKWIRRNGRLADRMPDGTDPAEWLESQPSGERPLEAALKAELGARLWARVDDLSPECREILRSYYREERSYKEIAGQIREKLGTVGSRLLRCLERLRQHLKSDEDFRNFFPPPVE